MTNKDLYYFRFSIDLEDQYFDPESDKDFFSLKENICQMINAETLLTVNNDLLTVVVSRQAETIEQAIEDTKKEFRHIPGVTLRNIIEVPFV